MGRVVYKNDFTAANNNKLTISAADLPAGTYAATIYFDGNMIAEKITIAK